jgi:hypothetical protein
VIQFSLKLQICGSHWTVRCGCIFPPATGVRIRHDPLCWRLSSSPLQVSFDFDYFSSNFIKICDDWRLTGDPVVRWDSYETLDTSNNSTTTGASTTDDEDERGSHSSVSHHRESIFSIFPLISNEVSALTDELI